MSGPTYAELIRTLFPQVRAGIHWGLGPTRRLLAAVGDPQRTYRVIHVGGTNGKGSVAATLESVLRADGRRTGLYSSPHLCTFRERIRIGGLAIGETALLRAAERLWPAVQAERPTFFEATTAIALLALAEAGVDTAVVEVGLGGRLDATNGVEPVLCVLTNVAFDHVQFLGPTLGSIAGEKAGILKQGVPAVTAERSAEALAVFRARAAEVGAPLRTLPVDEPHEVHAGLDGTRFGTVTAGWGRLALHTPLIGRHQATNAALAVHALDALPAEMRPAAAAVTAGVAGVRWPGRLQIEGIADRTWVFDVAHNVAAVETLVDALADLPLARPLVVLVGVLGDKDWAGMLGPLLRLADAAVLTLPPTAPADRRWDPHAVLAGLNAGDAVAEADFGRALERVWQRAGPGGTILVTGSFHTVGDALTALGRAPDGTDVTLPVAAFAV